MYAFFIKIKKVRAFLALIDKFSGSIILQIFLLYHQNTLLSETFAGIKFCGWQKFDFYKIKIMSGYFLKILIGE